MRGDPLTRPTSDLIDVVEGAYHLGSEAEWLQRLVDGIRPFFDRGLGVVAYDYFAAPGRAVETRHMARCGGGPETCDAIRSLNASVPLPLVERTYRARTGCATTSEMSGLGRGLASLPVWASSMAPLGAGDYLGINAIVDPGGWGCNVGAPLPSVERVPTRTRSRWDRVAAHLAAGMRLRRGLLGESALEGAEAVLTPDGRLEHAEIAALPAREHLRRAAQRMDRARGRVRRDDADRALDLWNGLVAGRWSLVDHFERGGRRYLVARRNDPDIGDPRGLSVRERQVAWYVSLGHSNKLVAYELGLGVSTVAAHLGRAMTKLGVVTRVELIALVRALASTSTG